MEGINKESYQPSKEEMEQAEVLMTDSEHEATLIREDALKKWEGVRKEGWLTSSATTVRSATGGRAETKELFGTIEDKTIRMIRWDNADRPGTYTYSAEVYDPEDKKEKTPFRVSPATARTLFEKYQPLSVPKEAIRKIEDRAREERHLRDLL